MSSAPNHRRGHGRIQGNGPRWENPNPEAGCNSTHVARSRKKWKRRRHHRHRARAKQELQNMPRGHELALLDLEDM